MAKIYNNKQNPDDPKDGSGPVKPAAKPAGPAKPAAAPGNPRLADATRRAQSMAKANPTSPAQFFQEAWVELKKTTWPDRDVLTKSTTVVLALVVAVAIWVGGIDFVLGRIAAPLFSASGH